MVQKANAYLELTKLVLEKSES